LAPACIAIATEHNTHTVALQRRKIPLISAPWRILLSALPWAVAVDFPSPGGHLATLSLCTDNASLSLQQENNNNNNNNNNKVESSSVRACRACGGATLGNPSRSVSAPRHMNGPLFRPFPSHGARK